MKQNVNFVTFFRKRDSDGLLYAGQPERTHQIGSMAFKSVTSLPFSNAYLPGNAMFFCNS